jgi:hypothetical protein
MKVITLEKTVDCFGFCGEVGKECSALYETRCPLRFGGKCNFHKTREQFDADQKKVVLWFSQLPTEKRKKLVAKYGSEFLK